MILALDPSSTRTGYALLSRGGQLGEAGLLKPAKTADPAACRIETMCQDLRELLETAGPATVVIEWTSGKIARRGRGRGINGAGLAIYGIAVGALWREVCNYCSQDRQRRCQLIAENIWTAGTAKAKRQAMIARRFARYDPASDPGGDVADAIGLGCYYLETLRLGELMQLKAQDRKAGIT